ncbi:GIY-YIG nuclease family protein [Aeromonas sp. 603359]|uniref:GIY-YIG nuclease family protein n=1 Tax=Aeromonas TaxID=642 RepID=UPI003B9EC423
MIKPPDGISPHASPPSSRWFIYMVRTATGLLYTGISTDPLRRLRQHQSGKGARALRGKGPLTLAWQQEVGEKGAALRLEYRLKQQPKSFKEQLIYSPALWQSWSPQWLPAATQP